MGEMVAGNSESMSLDKGSGVSVRGNYDVGVDIEGSDEDTDVTVDCSLVTGSIDSSGIFYEGSEEVEVDVFKKLEEKKVLSNVEKAGVLSKAEELGLTLSSIEKLGLFSMAEELGLLSLLEKATALSSSTLASAALPFLAAAIAAIVLIPDDSTALVAAQAVVAGGLAVVAVGCFVGSIVLGSLQTD